MDAQKPTLTMHGLILLHVGRSTRVFSINKFTWMAVHACKSMTVDVATNIHSTPVHSFAALRSLVNCFWNPQL